MSNARLLVSPNGAKAAWLHPLDLTTGHYPQYADWHDATDLSDEDFEALVVRLQGAQFLGMTPIGGESFACYGGVGI